MKGFFILNISSLRKILGDSASKAFALIMLLCSPVAFAQATYIEPNGLQLTCYAPHKTTGQIVPVQGINGFAGGFWGYATWDASGWPTMIFDVDQLSQLPIIVARFTFYHECAHLSVPTADEVLANCMGLKTMRQNGHIDQAGEDFIGQITYSFAVLPPQYGGSGSAFWNATLVCANR